MKSMAGIALIAVGLILVFTGTYILFSKKNKGLVNNKPTIEKNQRIDSLTIVTRDEQLAANELDKQYNSVVLTTSSIPDKKVNRNSKEESKRKGDEFEKFMVQKFNKKYFALKEWTSDKFINGTYPDNNLNPDLIYQFSLNEISEGLAIECKWRSKLSEKYKIVTSQQLENYKKFEKDRNIPVFLVIGVGGEPSAPQELFIVPLNKVNSTDLNKKFLQEFEQEANRNVFFDYNLKSLTTKSLFKVKQDA